MDIQLYLILPTLFLFTSMLFSLDMPSFPRSRTVSSKYRSSAKHTPRRHHHYRHMQDDSTPPPSQLKSCSVAEPSEGNSNSGSESDSDAQDYVPSDPDVLSLAPLASSSIPASSSINTSSSQLLSSISEWSSSCLGSQVTNSQTRDLFKSISSLPTSSSSSAFTIARQETNAGLRKVVGRNVALKQKPKALRTQVCCILMFYSDAYSFVQKVETTIFAVGQVIVIPNVIEPV